MMMCETVLLRAVVLLVGKRAESGTFSLRRPFLFGGNPVPVPADACCERRKIYRTKLMLYSGV